jgi:hypothetical protein
VATKDQDGASSPIFGTGVLAADLAKGAGRVINLAVAESARSPPRASPPRALHRSPASWSAPMSIAPTTYAIRVDCHLDDHWSACATSAPSCPSSAPGMHGADLPVGARAPAAHRAPHSPSRHRPRRRPDLEVPPVDSVNEWLTGCPADLDGCRRDTQPELGWVLDQTYLGRGYATEAVRELLRYCFQDLSARQRDGHAAIGAPIPGGRRVASVGRTPLDGQQAPSDLLSMPPTRREPPGDQAHLSKKEPRSGPA